MNLAGIAHILDLETRNSQLASDYTQLELLNAKIKADQRPVPGRTRRQKNDSRIPSRPTSTKLLNLHGIYI